VIWPMERFWNSRWRLYEERDVHLGGCEKLSREDALQNARKMKAEALGISIAVPQSSNGRV